jgi:murein L,D-transpeptidase YafK
MPSKSQILIFILVSSVVVAVLPHLLHIEKPIREPVPIELPDGELRVTQLKSTKREPEPSDFHTKIPKNIHQDKKSIYDDVLNIFDKPEKIDLESERLDSLDLATLMKEKNMKMGTPVFIRAFKEERELEVFLQTDDGTYDLLRTYPIVAASGDLGPKIQEGDGQVPEGFYFSSQQSMKPDSAYHLAFNVGYPNAFDRANGRTGSYIMVHGSNVSIGCLAMTDEKIEEIYALCQAALNAGQPFFRIHIFPFRMNEERMQKAASSEHHDFWKNLKTGYDLFEQNRVPPNTGVKDKQYTFE